MLLPTRCNAAVLFLDLQEEIVRNCRTLPIERLHRASGALAKLAALHQLPTFLSSVPPGGAFLDVVLSPLGNPTPRPRTGTSAFVDAGLVEALQASGRRVLILAGVASEIVVQRTALDALAAGYSVQVAVDASGGIDPRPRTRRGAESRRPGVSPPRSRHSRPSWSRISRPSLAARRSRSFTRR